MPINIDQNLLNWYNIKGILGSIRRVVDATTGVSKEKKYGGPSLSHHVTKLSNTPISSTSTN